MGVVKVGEEGRAVTGVQRSNRLVGKMGVWGGPGGGG